MSAAHHIAGRAFNSFSGHAGDDCVAVFDTLLIDDPYPEVVPGKAGRDMQLSPT
jgi:hypothetical protein